MTPKQERLRKAYESKLGKKLADQLTDQQIAIISKYYNSLSDKESSEIESQIIQGRNNTELHEMAESFIAEKKDSSNISIISSNNNEGTLSVYKPDDKFEDDIVEEIEEKTKKAFDKTADVLTNIVDELLAADKKKFEDFKKQEAKRLADLKKERDQEEREEDRFRKEVDKKIEDAAIASRIKEILGKQYDLPIGPIQGPKKISEIKSGLIGTTNVLNSKQINDTYGLQKQAPIPAWTNIIKSPADDEKEILGKQYDLPIGPIQGPKKISEIKSGLIGTTNVLNSREIEDKYGLGRQAPIPAWTNIIKSPADDEWEGETNDLLEGKLDNLIESIKNEPSVEPKKTKKSKKSKKPLARKMLGENVKEMGLTKSINIMLENIIECRQALFDLYKIEKQRFEFRKKVDKRLTGALEARVREEEIEEGSEKKKENEFIVNVKKKLKRGLLEMLAAGATALLLPVVKSFADAFKGNDDKKDPEVKDPEVKDPVIDDTVVPSGSEFGPNANKEEKPTTETPPDPEPVPLGRSDPFAPFNSGGLVPGPKINKDIIPAMLTPGEFVMNKGAVDKFGLGTMLSMNEPTTPVSVNNDPAKFNTGGLVSGPKINKDIIPAMLTPGEFVMNKGAVDKFGLENMLSMNVSGGGTNRPSNTGMVPGYNQGGQVGDYGANLTHKSPITGYPNYKKPEDMFGQFYARIYKAAKAAGDPFPEVVAAQAVEESNFGKSALAVEANNLFGQDAPPNYPPSRTYVYHDPKEGKHTAIKFDSIEDSVKYRVRIWKKYYGDAKTPSEAIANIAAADYNPWPEYPGKINSIMEEYGVEPGKISPIINDVSPTNQKIFADKVSGNELRPGNEVPGMVGPPTPKININGTSELKPNINGKPTVKPLPRKSLLDRFSGKFLDMLPMFKKPQKQSSNINNDLGSRPIGIAAPQQPFS